MAINVNNTIAGTYNEIVIGQASDNPGSNKNHLSFNTGSTVTFKDRAEKKPLCPLIPFMAITGKPTKVQLQKYLDNFHSVGIEQFLIYPRSGLELEYMSDEWLDVCQHIIEYAAQNGMSVWLYDEFNWPSGKCGGQVIRKNEDFACQKLTVWADFDPMGKKLGNSKSNNKYYWNVSSVPLYADVLNPAAVDTFIELTHAKYFNRFSQYFGNVIKGFFSDEPSPEYAALHHKTNGSLLELPYWTELETEYLKYTNRDFRLDVEEYLNGSPPSGLWKDYFFLLGKKFKASYFDKLRMWCDQHNVLFTGHLMAESNPSQSIWASGNPLDAISSFSMPGMDEIFTRTTIESMEWVTLKMVENAARKSGEGAFAELFALGPSDMPLGKMRQMIWITALNGVDHYLLAISPLDARGNILKPHYYNPNTTTQPWFKAFRELGEDAKKAASYALKKVDYKIAVRFPQTITATSIFKKGKGLPVTLPELMKSLVNWQWDPRLIEEDASDTAAYQSVLIIDESGIKEEKSGLTFSSLNELSAWLEQNIKRSAFVENAEGTLQKNVLLKTFRDGSICIVSLFDKPQEHLMLKQPGIKPLKFEIPEYGVFFYEPGQNNSLPKSEIILSSEELLNYNLLSTNTIRTVFDEAGQYKFSLSENINELTILTRNYPETIRLILDGREIITDQTCQSLPEGLKELYLESDKFSLQKGNHILVLNSDISDYPYLPSAFISGKFATNKNNLLGALPQVLSIGSSRLHGLSNYSGGIEFTKRVKLNNEGLLSINTGGLVTEVFINNQSIGRKAWAPFSWEIPAKFRNKTVELIILVTNSVGPLFGDYPRMKGEAGSFLREFAPK